VLVGAGYEDFTADLYTAEQEKECRYAVFDAEYEGGAGMQKNKILFFMWSVDAPSGEFPALVLPLGFYSVVRCGPKTVLILITPVAGFVMLCSYCRPTFVRF